MGFATGSTGSCQFEGANVGTSGLNPEVLKENGVCGLVVAGGINPLGVKTGAETLKQLPLPTRVCGVASAVPFVPRRLYMGGENVGCENDDGAKLKSPPPKWNSAASTLSLLPPVGTNACCCC